MRESELHPLTGKTIGPVRLLAQLGGTMHPVFFARHDAHGEVAARVARIAPEAREPFERLAKRLRQRHDHPSTLRILDGFVDEHDLAVTVAELATGGTLLAARAAAPDGRLSVTRALEVARGVLAGLGGVPVERHVVLFDSKTSGFFWTWTFKPEAVLFDQAGRARLSLLGELRLQSSDHLDLDPYGSVTEATAPEAVQDEVAPDGRTDVYSVGALLYHDLAGVGPFDREIQRLKRPLGGYEIRVKPPRPLREVAPAAPDAVAELVTSMLAKEWRDRPTLEGALAAVDRAIASAGA